MQRLDEIPALTVLSNFFLLAYLIKMIEYFGNSCLGKDSASPALSLMCKGNSANLSRTLPSDMSEFIFLVFMNSYKTKWEKETNT